jgi:hypothetical protein
MLMIPEATLDEIRRIAVRTLNEPTNPGDYWHGRLPDPEHFKALPQPVRQYLHDPETRADSAATLPQSRL